MAQSTKASRSKRAAGKTPDSATEGKEPKGRRARLIIAASVIAAIAITVVIGIYWTQGRPLQTKIIVVGEDTINIGYFIKRLQMDTTASGDPNLMLETLAHEMLIRQGAPRYGIEVTEEDVDEALREIARGESGTISDSEFKAWYRQQLNETELSNSEYRELARTLLLANRLQEYLAERVPSVAEQVHLHIILLESYEKALEVKEELDTGADFAEVAREVSIDGQTRENGGDLGWLPVDILEGSVGWAVSNLDTGEISEPVGISEEVFSIIKVSEKAVAREVEEDYLQVMKDKALDSWLVEEMNYKKIEFHGFNNGFDSETYYWIRTQLAKRAD